MMMEPSPLPSPAVEIIPAGVPLYRIHRTDRGAVFFDNSRHGRFNPPEALAGSFGTLYVAKEPAAAFVETLGRTRFLLPRTISERQLTTITFDVDLRVFAVDAPANRFVHGFDLGEEAIATTADYTRAQQLAAAVRDDGLDGLSYPARHDNASEFYSVALFGEPGGSSSHAASAQWSTEQIPGSLVDEMVDRYRFEVLDDVPLP